MNGGTGGAGPRYENRLSTWFRERGWQLLIHALLIVLALANIYPFVWMSGTSLKAKLESTGNAYSAVPLPKYGLATTLRERLFAPYYVDGSLIELADLEATQAAKAASEKRLEKLYATLVDDGEHERPQLALLRLLAEENINRRSINNTFVPYRVTVDDYRRKASKLREDLPPSEEIERIDARLTGGGMPKEETTYLRRRRDLLADLVVARASVVERGKTVLPAYEQFVADYTDTLSLTVEYELLERTARALTRGYSDAESPPASDAESPPAVISAIEERMDRLRDLANSGEVRADTTPLATLPEAAPLLDRLAASDAAMRELAAQEKAADLHRCTHELDQMVSLGSLQPVRIQPENYRVVWTDLQFWLYTATSFVVTASVVIIVVLMSSMLGFALARLSFPGKLTILMMLLLGAVAPHEAVIIPIFRFVMATGLLDNLWGMIFWMSGVSIGNAFLMAGFFLTLPKEVEEAARVDGAGPFRTFFAVSLPMAKPIVMTVGLLAFLGAWNNFLIPLLTAQARPEFQPLALAIFMFRSGYGSFWHQINAAATLMVVPVAILFLFLQRFIVNAIAVGAVKG